MALTNYVLMPGADYQAACDAIRAKTGKSEPIKSGELASEISGITGGGSGGSVEGVHTVTFMSEDGSAVLYERLVVDGDDCANVVDRGLLATQIKESTAQYSYTQSGWSLTPGGAADASALSAVKADRTVYAAFTSAVRYYTITYYDGDTVLKTESLPYGSMPSYAPEKDGYALNGWSPEIATVTGDATYTAQWKEQETLNDFSWETLAAMSLEEAQQRFKIGDRKSLNGDIFYATLVGFAHDDLADGSGKANMTFIINYPYTKQAYGYTGDWSSCGARDWFENNASTAAYLQDISPYAKRVNKDYVIDVNTGETAKSSDLFWMPSMTEFGYTATDVPVEGQKYEIFTDKATTSATIEKNGSYDIIVNSSVYARVQTRSLYLTDSTKHWAFTNYAPVKADRAYSGRGYPCAAFCI